MRSGEEGSIKRARLKSVSFIKGVDSGGREVGLRKALVVRRTSVRRRIVVRVGIMR